MGLRELIDDIIKPILGQVKTGYTYNLVMSLAYMSDGDLLRFYLALRGIYNLAIELESESPSIVSIKRSVVDLESFYIATIFSLYRKIKTDMYFRAMNYSRDIQIDKLMEKVGTILEWWGNELFKLEKASEEYDSIVRELCECEILSPRQISWREFQSLFNTSEMEILMPNINVLRSLRLDLIRHILDEVFERLRREISEDVDQVVSMEAEKVIARYRERAMRRTRRLSSR